MYLSEEWWRSHREGVQAIPKQSFTPTRFSWASYVQPLCNGEAACPEMLLTSVTEGTWSSLSIKRLGGSCADMTINAEPRHILVAL